jgi:transposase InsO family protein
MGSGGDLMKNDPHNNPELALAVTTAQFRFGLIAPVLQGTYPDSSAVAYYKRVTERPLQLPDGTTVKYSYKTLEKWVSTYKRFGFDSLMPLERSDKGTSRVLSDAAIERIYSIKMEFPRINATQIHQKLIQEGYLTPKVSVCAVQRFIKNHDLRSARNPNLRDRKAFEEDAFGKMWQADTKYLPYITENGKSRRVYCIGIIDDHSRMELQSELFYEDNAVNFQKVLKNSIAAYGVPQKLYVDNGCSYANEQLSLICGELGIALIHTKVRDGASKGKRERSWLTLDERLINTIDPSRITSLEQFNQIFREYVRSYNTTYHSGINCAPYERYENTKDHIRMARSSEWLENCFYNRIHRKVRNDSTISIDKVSYDVPMDFIGQKIEVRFIPSDMSTAFIYFDKKKYPIRATNKNENCRTKRKNDIVLDYSRISEAR